LGAYAEGRSRVSARIVDKAAGEVFDASPPRRMRAGQPTVIVGAAVLLGAAALAAWQLRPPTPQAVAKPAVAPVAPPAVAAKPVAAPIPAPAVAPRPVARWLNPEDLRPAADAPGADEVAAWQALGASWGLSLPTTDPCSAAMRQGVYCFRDAGSNLALIRLLGRPGILTLYNEQGQAVRWLLIGLGRESAELRAPGGEVQTVSLASLVAVWRGEFATLWQAPPDYRPNARGADAEAAIAAAAARLAARPEATAITPGETPRSVVAAFQLANGLKPDGKPGPLTLMHLNRVSGVDEPRLETLR